VLVGKQNFWLLNYHAKSHFQFKGITAKKIGIANNSEKRAEDQKGKP